MNLFEAPDIYQVTFSSNPIINTRYKYKIQIQEMATILESYALIVFILQICQPDLKRPSDQIYANLTIFITTLAVSASSMVNSNGEI